MNKKKHVSQSISLKTQIKKQIRYSIRKFSTVGVASAVIGALTLFGSTVQAEEISAATENNSIVVVESTPATTSVGEARENIQMAQTSVEEAKEAVASASTELLVKEQEVQQFETTYSEVQAEVVAANKAVNELIAEEVATAQAQYEVTAKEVATAEEKQASVEATHSTAQAQLEEAQKNYTKVAEAYPDTQERLVEKEESLSVALANQSTAERAVVVATEAVTSAKNDYEVKLDALTEAKSNEENAKVAVESAVTDVTEKATKAETATQQRQQAEQELASDAFYIEAKQAVEAAQAPVDNLKLEKEEKEAELAKLTIKLSTEQKNKVEKEAALAKAREELATENKELEQLSADQLSKEKEYSNKVAQTTAAQTGLTRAEAAVESQLPVITQAETDVKTNETSVAQLEKELTAAKAQEAATNEVLEASKALAKAEIAKGSKGFFEAMGSTKALEVLKTSATANDGTPMTQPTKMGQEGDATTLENMLKAIAYIKESNALRVAGDNNLPAVQALKVTDELMAIAQLNANYSRTHSGYNGDWGDVVIAKGKNAVGENLAWDERPFDGWYTAEKQFYEDNNGPVDYADNKSAMYGKWYINTTSHYTAMMKKDYYYTGYGYASRNQTSSQVFWMDTLDTAVTVDEYLARLEGYYNPLKERAAIGDPQLRTAYLTAKKARDSKEAELVAAQTTLTSAQDSLRLAQEKLATLTQEKQVAQTNLQAAQAVENAAKSALETAQQTVQKQSKIVEQKAAALPEKEQAVSEATVAEQSAQKLVVEKEAEISAVVTNLDTATTILEQAIATFQEKTAKLVELQSAVSNAKKQEEQATQELSTSKANLAEKEKQYQTAQSVKAQAESDVEGQLLTVSETEKQAQAALVRLEDAHKAVLSAETALQAIKEEYKELAAALASLEAAQANEVIAHEAVLQSKEILLQRQLELSLAEAKVHAANSINRTNPTSFDNYQKIKQAVLSFHQIVESQKDLLSQKEMVEKEVVLLREKLSLAKTVLSAEQRKLDFARNYLEEHFKAEIIFDPAGGQWSDQSKELRRWAGYIEDRVTVLEAPTRDGYKFLYWRGSVYQPGDVIVANKKSYTLTAVWEEIATSLPVKNTQAVNQLPASQLSKYDETKQVSASLSNGTATPQPVVSTVSQSSSKTKTLPNTGETRNVLFYLAGLAIMLVLAKRKRN
ncbi:TPA: YSIRK-type signal peptide-containing protein [Streptococcus suis]